MLIKCDGDKSCVAGFLFECCCARCQREHDAEERFHTCTTHRDQAEVKHMRIRDRAVVWSGTVVER